MVEPDSLPVIGHELPVPPPVQIKVQGGRQVQEVVTLIHQAAAPVADIDPESGSEVRRDQPLSLRFSFRPLL
jgi:hypothetical protein